MRRRRSPTYRARAENRQRTALDLPTPTAWAGDDGGGLRVIIPRRALAWFSFPTDCARFSF